jgi:hypothetical protein
VNSLIASRVVPFLLGIAMIPTGFAVVTACMDSTSNHDCGRYNTSIAVGILVQALLFVLAMVSSLRSLRTTWLTKAIVVASVATFAGALAFGV